MTMSMNTIGPGLATLLLLTAVGSAEARPMAVDTQNVPEACHELARVPASAQIPRPVMSARISVANCMATENLRTIELTDDADSIRALNAGAAPSLALLDHVIRTSTDPEEQIIAQHAKADLLIGLQIRMRNTIETDLDNIAEAERRRAQLEPQLVAWQQGARGALDQVAALAGEFDQDRSNPVVAYVIDASEQALEGTGTAVARP